MSRGTSSAALVVMLLVATGCGSTSHDDARRRPRAGVSGASAVSPTPDADAAEPEVAAAGAESSSRPGNTAGAPAGQTATGPTGSPGSPGAAPALGVPPGTSGHGYDARRIYIGINTTKDAQAVFNASGFHGLDQGDMQADGEAVIATINATGGLFGRMLVGVYHDVSTAQSGTNPSAAAEAACTDWTQDHQVVAVVTYALLGLDNDTFYRCMARSRTPIFTGFVVVADREFQHQYSPYLYLLQAPTWDNLMPVLINRLLALRYFTGWNAANGSGGPGAAKVGLLYSDYPQERRIFSKLARELTARGIRVVAQYASDTSAGFSGAQASLASAVLRFRSEGVTHVIPDNASSLLFAQQAESQNYRPRYAVTSLFHPAAQQQNLPASQLQGALGIGWSPMADLNRPMGAAATACLDQLRRRGTDYAGQATARHVALVVCDGLRLITQAAIAGNGLSATALATGVGAAGPKFTAAGVLRSGFSPSRVDAVGAVRDIGFQAKCSCFDYLAATEYPIP